MHNATSLMFRALLLAAALGSAMPASGAPFAYRGTLDDHGAPANGRYGFRLTFYGAPSGGAALAPATTLDDVVVENGAFEAALELAPSLQQRDGTWLEVEVRDAGGAFVVLPGREAVGPKALAAGVCWDTTGNAGTVAASNFLGTTDGAALRLQSTAGVGINTTAPLAPLHVKSASAGSIAPVGGSAGVFEGSGHTYVSVFSPAASERGVLFGMPGTFNNAADGAIIYNNANTRSLQFRTGANVTRMQLGVSEVESGAVTNPQTNLQLFAQDTGLPAVYFKTEGVAFLPVLAIGFVGSPYRFRISPLGAQMEGDLNVTGSAYKPGGGSWSASSDARLKKNIAPLEGSLDRLLALRGVSFEYASPDAAMHPIGVQTGFVAQDVQKVFPQWVATGPDGYLTVGPRGFEALAVEAMRQLARENEELQADNAALRAREEALEKRLARIERQLK